jgi:hypothetical protein
MYRKRASKSALQGVLSGPYAGGARTIDAARMPRNVRQRLADVLAYRAEPTPLLHERPHLASRFHPTWLLAASLVVIAMLTAFRFGDPRSDLAVMPPSLLLAYVLPSLGLTLSLLALVRWRARVGGDSLSAGRWLLPLDVVEVSAPDAEGRQSIVVTPLGDARDAEVRIDGRRRELVLSFDAREPVTFSLRADADGEVTLRRLEHAQHLLEDLTYGRNLEKALAQDPFFDVRVDDSWAELAEPQALPPRERMLHGRVATIAAAVLAAGIAVFGWAGRNRLSDRALFLRAARGHTVAAYDEYLRRGRAYRELATALRDEVAREDAAREKERKDAEAASAFDERSPFERCVEGLRASAAKAHPEITDAMIAMVARSERGGTSHVPVHFTREVDALADDATDALALDARETDTLSVLERMFSLTCPAMVLSFGRGADLEEGGVEVRYRVTKSGPPWLLAPNPAAYACGPSATGPTPCPPHGKLAVQPVELVFDVSVRGVTGQVVSTFHLTMPRPAEAQMSVRLRSLFILDGAPAPPGSFDTRVYGSMSARAFDRLYDELHGLFFEGDPVVPLRAVDVVP